MKRALQLDPIDNVAVVIQDVSAGDEISIGDSVIIAYSDINMPHKIALADLSVGDGVFKYGEIIGYATAGIKKGEHVHIHNLDSEKIMK